MKTLYYYLSPTNATFKQKEKENIRKMKKSAEDKKNVAKICKLRKRFSVSKAKCIQHND